VKQRLSLSVDKTTANYLTARAQGETNGNVSALVDRIVRQSWLAEAVRSEVEWYKAHPGFVEDAERERYLSGAA
jgi:hypothetical protein